MATEADYRRAQSRDDEQHFKALFRAYEIVLQDARLQCKLAGDLTTWMNISKRYSFLKHKIENDEQTDTGSETAVN